MHSEIPRIVSHPRLLEPTLALVHLVSLRLQAPMRPLAQLTPENLNPTRTGTRRPYGMRSLTLARIQPPIIPLRLEKPCNLRNPHRSHPLRPRPPRLLFLRLNPKPSTVRSLPVQHIHRVLPASRAKAAACRWYLERPVAGASWPTRARHFRLRA